MKKYIKPETKSVNIEILPLLAIDSNGNGNPDWSNGDDDSDTGSPLTKGNGNWINEDDLGW